MFACKVLDFQQKLNSPERIKVSTENRGFLPLGFCKPYHSLGWCLGCLGTPSQTQTKRASLIALKTPDLPDGVNLLAHTAVKIPH